MLRAVERPVWFFLESCLGLAVHVGFVTQFGAVVMSVRELNRATEWKSPLSDER